MQLIEISILIITVIGCVHFVHRKAYKAGIAAGIEKGRIQVLEENLIRESVHKPLFDQELISMIESNPREDYSELHSQIQAGKKDRRAAVTVQ